MLAPPSALVKRSFLTFAINVKEDRTRKTMKITTLAVTVAFVTFTSSFVCYASADAKQKTQQFPPHPTMVQMKQRVPDWMGFVRMGRCEQPSRTEKYGVAWHNQGPTWGGGLGIYKQTWYAAGSPYRLWSGSIPETILVADAIRDRFGITAWGAHACFRP